MKSPTFVYFKVQETDTAIQFDLTPLMNSGETLTSVTKGTVNPVTSPVLGVTVQTTNQLVTQCLLTDGVDNTSYGIPFQVVTNVRTFQVLVAVTVGEDSFIPYQTSNPDAFSDLVDQIQAGEAAIGTAIFQFTPDIDPSGGYVTWEFMDASGAVYAYGNAFDYAIKSNGLANTVISRAVINVPSSVPASLVNQKYQLRYTLTLTGVAAGSQSVFYSYENVSVVGLNTVPLGTQPSVEMKGDPVTLSLVTDTIYDNLGVEIYQDNTVIATWTQITDFERVANGYYWAGVIDSTNMAASLVPYTVVWKFWQSANPGQVFRQSTSLWIVTPTIMTAVEDVKARVAKARTTLYGSPDMLYSTPTVMLWLRRGADAFNGAYGVFTSFTFLNAKGPVREFWLMMAEIAAISSQYLAEGEKAFNFQGAGIQLEVDRTQYLTEAMTRMQAILDNELKAVKQNLVIKGNTTGDGSADPSRLSIGAIGAVGISITPASMWGAYGRPFYNGLK